MGFAASSFRCLVDVVPVKNEDGAVIMFILNFEDLAQLLAKSSSRSLTQRLLSHSFLGSGECCRWVPVVCVGDSRPPSIPGCSDPDSGFRGLSQQAKRTGAWSRQGQVRNRQPDPAVHAQLCGVQPGEAPLGLHHRDRDHRSPQSGGADTECH